jgi:hypothetical protein
MPPYPDPLMEEPQQPQPQHNVVVVVVVSIISIYYDRNDYKEELGRWKLKLSYDGCLPQTSLVV